jgi:hypothetical protein
MKWSQNESSTHEGINYLLHVFVVMLKEIQCYFFLRCQFLMLFVMANSHHVVKYMLKSPYTIPHLSLKIMSFFGQLKWAIEFITWAIFLHLHVANSNWSLRSTLLKPTTYSSCFACIKIIIFWNFKLGWRGRLICKTW